MPHPTLTVSLARLVTSAAMRRAVLLVVGVAAALAGAAFVVRRLVDEWSASRHLLADASPAWLALAWVLAAAGMVAVAVGWRRVLATLGAPVRVGRAVPWYFAGEITKYVPGLVWPVIGRAELARRGGVRRPTAYASVAASLAALVRGGGRRGDAARPGPRPC